MPAPEVRLPNRPTPDNQQQTLARLVDLLEAIEQAGGRLDPAARRAASDLMRPMNTWAASFGTLDDDGRVTLPDDDRQAQAVKRTLFLLVEIMAAGHRGERIPPEPLAGLRKCLAVLSPGKPVQQECAPTAASGEPREQAAELEEGNPDHIKFWCVRLHTEWLDRNERRKTAGMEPHRKPGGRKIAKYLNAHGYEVTHPTAMKFWKQAEEQGLLADTWDATDDHAEFDLETVPADRRPISNPRTPRQRQPFDDSSEL